jgi:hypothetical protein
VAAHPDAPKFTASNRPGHGGGKFAGKGFSADLFLNESTDRRGFWKVSTAIRFLLVIDLVAKSLGARWQVLYDDFRVAQEVNRITGSRNVVFQGTISQDRLNWHGPKHLILHFHLDVEFPAKASGTSTPP